MVNGERQWVTYDSIDYEEAPFADIGTAFETQHPVTTTKVGWAELRALSMRDAVDFAKRALKQELGGLLARLDRQERAVWQDLPAVPGVYAVCLPGWEAYTFTTEAGRAHYAEPADPSLLCDKRDQILAAGSTDILYIGKAGAKTSDLRQRVRQLVLFGVGRTSKHKGGEWLWQLKGIDEAQVMMWCCPRGEPEHLERKLLKRFRLDHGD